MKLNQVVALSSGTKTRVQKATTEIFQNLQKPTLLEGILKTYKPTTEGGETYPQDKKNVQLTVRKALQDYEAQFSELFDIVATQDYANCQARADVTVDALTLVKDAPVTFLLFLEKKLVDIYTCVDKLPTLDPAEKWEYSKDAGHYAAEPYQTVSKKAVMRNHVKAKATDKHPEQVEVYKEEETQGHWTTRKFSGAIPMDEKTELLRRVRRAQDAIKLAREHANGISVEQKKVAKDIFSYIFRS